MKIGTTSLLCTLVLGGILSPLAQAQITPQGGGYLFRIKYVKGEKVKYNMGVNVKTGSAAPTGGAGNQKMSMSMTQEVLSLANGNATLKVTNGPMTSNGKPMGTAQVGGNTMVVNNRGKVVTGSNTGIASTEMPVGPVKIGGVWTTSASIPQMGGMVETVNKFIGIRTVAGQKVAEVKITLKGKSLDMAGNGTMFLRLKDGSVQSLSITMKAAIPVGSGGSGTQPPKPVKMTIQTTMSRA